MSKRKLKEYNNDELNDLIETTSKKKPPCGEKKHTLDSDEEDDNDDAYNVLQEDDIEGAEDGAVKADDEQRYTAFNMKEEMEEGHFDKDGHFLWKKEKEVKDSWLDSIDWQKIHKKGDAGEEKPEKGLGDESDSDEEEKKESEEEIYEKILVYMKPGETVAKAIKRLGGNKQISSTERWKRKKAGLPEVEVAEGVTKLTELANKLLTNTGNMDVYQETYEQISAKISKKDKGVEMDIFADEFEESKPTTSKGEEEKSNEIRWEFKWKQEDKEIHGPHSTEQMQQWVVDGYFKEGVWVRKVGQEGNFYTSNRIDFEIYY